MDWSGELKSKEALPSIVAKMADHDPDRPFVHVATGGSVNWGELQQNAEVWAASFIALGVRKGDIVVTLLDAGIESLSVWLGLSKIGAIDAATNSEYRGRLLSHAINNCRPSLIVVAQQHLTILEDIAADLAAVPRVVIIDSGEADLGKGIKLPQAIGRSAIEYDLASASAKFVVPQMHDIACITYTSGTTGPSKAVQLPWGQFNCINLGSFPYEDFDASDVIYCFTSHAHFGSKSIPYFAAMLGAKVVMRPRFSLNGFWDDIGRFGITTASLVGTMADMLMRSPDSPPKETTLRKMFMAPLGPSYRQFSERYGVRICTAYNSTEGGVAINSGWNPANPKTVGRLRQGYPGFEVRIVDEDDFEVPDGTSGECIIRSSVPWTMNAGYLNNPDATATAWRNGWFHTGDALMCTEAGDYVFVDRLKDVIRRRGENISSYEVETDVMLNPEIVECAAVAVPADTSEDEILLFVVKRPGSAICAQELCADLETRMPRFMVPRFIEFVDSLPKTQATERIVKADLRRRGIGPQTWDRERREFVSAANVQ